MAIVGAHARRQDPAPEDGLLRQERSSLARRTAGGDCHYTQLRKGVPPLIPSSYNDLAMSTVCDAAHESQFASCPVAQVRVLAALPGVSAALSGQSAIAIASQPLR
jgi:hypothetical protein